MRILSLLQLLNSHILITPNMKRLALITLCALGTSLSWAQHSYTLEQIVDSARQNNIAMRSAAHDIDAAQQQRREAFTKYFPNVSATGAWFDASKPMAEMELNLSDNISPELGAALAQSMPPEALAALNQPMAMAMMKHGAIASISATQPVFAGGRIVNGNRLARVGEDVSRLQLRLAEDEVEKTAQQYFWQMVTLEEKMNTLKAVETFLNDIHKDVSLAVKAGLVLRNDLLQVQLRQNDVESQKAKLQNAISLVRMLLAQYCALSDTSFTLSYPTEAAAPATLRRDHQQALASTAEYQLLDKQVEAANLQKKMAVGEQLPSLAVGAGYNYHNMLGTGQHFGIVFATVSVPLSGWWGGSHAIKRKRIAEQKAIEQRADNAQLLTIRMQKAWNDVVEAYQQLDIAARSIEQAEENLRINRNCYQAGTITMSDLLEAQMLYQQALDKRTDLFADYQNKVLEYKHAVGM